MGLLLFIIAQITTPIFNWFGLLYSVFRANSWKEWNEYLKDIAISKDQNSNVVMKYLFNDIMIAKKSIHKFGNEDETISSVFGKNQLCKTLLRFGRFWNRFLSKIEKNHSINSIEWDERIK